MVHGGAIDEVKSITEWSPTAAKAIGVSEILQLIRGEIGEAECIAGIDMATSRYAKRQSTWFRRESWLTSVPGDQETEAMEIARAAGLL